MIFEEKNKIAFILCAMFLRFNAAYAQLDLVSNQQIDFSNAVNSISSGDWSNPNIWSNGVVPSGNTNVIIEDGHTVYIDIEGNASGQIVDLSKNLFIKQGAVLQMGHNTPNFAKDLRINGSILCNGTFSAGRNQPGGSGDGSIYNFNSRIFLNLTENTTYVSGSGYFHPRALSINSTAENNNLIIDMYTIVIDDNFAIKSNNRVNATITYHSYMHIKKTLGLTGSVFQFSAPTAKADLTIEGVVIADNVSLFTKNPIPGEGSSLTIANKGSLYVQKINEDDLNVASETAGFDFAIQNGALFRIGEGVDFDNLTQSNPNFTFSNNGELRPHYSETMSSSAEITSSINSFDPNEGAEVEQIKDIFGASHIAGWYNFTDRPYLLEGLDFYEDFGATSIKTTLTAVNNRMFNAYHFNHSWQNFQTLKNVAEHQHVDSLFQRTHIKTHTFWTTSKNQGDWKQGPDFNHESYLDEEEQFYELTKHLLETYGNVDKTFVYQNWEGDWMLRGEGVLWEQNSSLIPDNVNWEIEGMARMFRARQRGTERARNEYTDANAKVFHAIEFNKLWWEDNGVRKTMMESNVPSVLGEVVPKTRLDMSSWSAYDGLWTNGSNPHGHAMWKGLEIAKYFTTETGEVPFSTPVQIGEIGINENPPFNGNNDQTVIENRYGKYIGVALGLDIPNVYLWNLYGSGQQGGPDDFTWEKDTQYDEAFLYQWLDGKWLLEPDGNWGIAAAFLMQQWEDTMSVEDHYLYNKDNIILYPNPTSGYFELMNLDTPSTIRIFDQRGKLVKLIDYQPEMKIDMSELSKGLYYLNIINSKNLNSTKKLLVK